MDALARLDCTTLQSWLPLTFTDNRNCCNTHRSLVRCNAAGRVLGLSMDGIQVSEIYFLLPLLTELNSLRITNAGLADVPDFVLTDFPLLTDIDFSNNALTGAIPAELGNMQDLVSLKLANNRITGSLPASILRLRNLRTLDLSSNQLSGEMPDLDSLTRLSTCNLQDVGTACRNSTLSRCSHNLSSCNAATNSSAESSGNRLSTGGIVAIVVVVAFLVAMCALFAYCIRRSSTAAKKKLTSFSSTAGFNQQPQQQQQQQPYMHYGRPMSHLQSTNHPYAPSTASSPYAPSTVSYPPPPAPGHTTMPYPPHTASGQPYPPTVDGRPASGILLHPSAPHTASGQPYPPTVDGRPASGILLHPAAPVYASSTASGPTHVPYPPAVQASETSLIPPTVSSGSSGHQAHNALNSGSPQPPVAPVEVGFPDKPPFEEMDSSATEMVIPVNDVHPIPLNDVSQSEGQGVRSD
ncbi:MAG: hypothetical protein SGCHY_004940 [Lobulomycetales sp.]